MKIFLLIRNLVFKIISNFLFFFIKDKTKIVFYLIFYYRNLRYYFYRLFFNKKLSFFLKLGRTDKYDQYKNNYDLIGSILPPNKKYKILEIGIGGHNKLYQGGDSLLALSHFYNKSEIYGADIINKDFLNSRNIKTLILDQGNSENLKDIGKKYGPFDLIIDDGSHFANHQKISFENLFEYLADEGFYIIEDMEGNYLSSFNGDPNLSTQKNNISFFSTLVHSVNSAYLHKDKYDELGKYINIEKIFFLSRMIIINKKIKNHKIVEYKDLEKSLKEIHSFKTESGFIDLEKKSEFIRKKINK